MAKAPKPAQQQPIVDAPEPTSGTIEMILNPSMPGTDRERINRRRKQSASHVRSVRHASRIPFGRSPVPRSRC